MNREDGLWIFCAVVACNVVGLVADYILAKIGIAMVSEVARRNVFVALAIVSHNALGLVGICFHLWGKTGGQ